MTDNSLSHYGVRGMRWGRRKAADGGYEDSGRPKRGERSADSAEVRELRRHHVNTLSNSEIRKINERMNLEQNYRNLEANASAIGRGRSHVRSIMSDANTVNQGLRLVDPQSSPLARLGFTLIERRNK